MDRQELKELYFQWLYGKVFSWDKDFDERFTFTKLLRYLHSVTFYSSFEMDENRAVDGMDLRYEFGYEKGYSDQDITIYLDDTPCSVLEMMVALAIRCERNFMLDNEYGDRTGQWFRKMLSSLGFSGMYNANFDQDKAEEIIERFLNHEYEANGKGGLFAIKHPTRDMRTQEIWGQLSSYINTIT